MGSGRFQQSGLNIVIVWTLTFFIAGAGSLINPIDYAEERMQNGKTVVIDQRDYGKEIDVKVGEVVQVELEMMGTAGYEWFAEGVNQEVLRLISQETRVLHPGKIGAPLIMVWKFEAIKEGFAEIRMNHYRSWEGKEQSTDHFEAKIRVIH